MGDHGHTRLDDLCARLDSEPLADLHEAIWHELAAGLPDIAELESLDDIYERVVNTPAPDAVGVGDGRTSSYIAKVRHVESTMGGATSLQLELALGRRYRRVHEGLYHQLEVVDALFKEHGIQYWIVSGTLLAAERHQRIIPWDTDVDLEISEADIPRLEALRGELESAGMGLRLAFPHHYKLAKQFDVFAWDNRPSRVKGGDLFPTREETFPLKMFKLGDLILPGPGFVNRSLARSYGADWREIGRVWNYGFNNYWGTRHEPGRYLVEIEALHRELGWTLDPSYIHQDDV